MHEGRQIRRVLLTLALLPLAAVVARGQSAPQIRFPDPDIGVDTLAARAKAQAETVSQFKVFHDFRFTDRIKDTGITFVHQAVDDVKKQYRPVHYDHGNGLAVADVDGDAREDIYFVNQVGGNELWKSLGGGKFRNITSEAGVAVPSRISVAASFGDIDNDGDHDLFVTTVRGGNVLFENDGKGRFKDITSAAGLNLTAHSSGALFFDYDKDGLSDLFVCNVGRYTSDEKGAAGQYRGLPDAFTGHLHPGRTEYPALYRNQGGNKFKDLSEALGVRPKAWCGDASFADLNTDGWPDLYLLNMQGASHYYENVSGKSFASKTASLFPKTPWGSMGIKFFDFDNDGLTDLFITDMHSDMSEEVGPEREKLKARIQWPPDYLQTGNASIFGNAFYRNLGGGKFEEISDRVGAENYWPWGLSVDDLNADGWDDAFLTSGMGFPFRYGINTLLLNNRGEKFLDAEFLLGVEPRRDGRTHTAWFDLDCSGEDKEHAQCKGQTGKVTVMATLSSRASVMLDLEGDGDLDMVTNELNDVPMVLVSDLSAKKKIQWLKVGLEGTASNRNGFGAVVRVTAGGRSWTKTFDGKSGYLSQSVLPLYFGLGDAAKVDQVDVTWPSGTKQVVTQGLRVNDTLRIKESK
jgi:enediyne biosynthesis protein E4